MIWIGIIAAAALAAWLPWRGELNTAASWLGAACRFAAALALIILLADPQIPFQRPTGRPLVLLDNSLSMHASRGAYDSAAAMARRLGDVVTFGELADGVPGGTTMAAPAVVAAAASSRPVVVVTDGEIDDFDAIPADLLERVSVELVTGERRPDVGIVAVEAPPRFAVGDTVRFMVELKRSAGWQGTAPLELRDGERVLGRGEAVFDGTGAVRRTELRVNWPPDLVGERWLEVVRTGDPDGEPLNDRRWIGVSVSASPGVVLVVTHADWDGRAAYTGLKSVTEMTVRGFIRLGGGEWRRMENLEPVAEAAVRRAAAGADVLVIRGDPAPWRGLGRSQLRWLPPEQSADWYAGELPHSPLSGAMIGIDLDSLPSLPGVRRVSEQPMPEWIGLTMQAGRRGQAVPVIAGYDGTPRVVEFGASGMGLWSARGGAAGQFWRGALAQSVGWLLGTGRGPAATVEPASKVVSQGEPVRFVGGEAAAAVAITLTADGSSRSDTLRFDNGGSASLVLSPGLWHYTVGPDSGSVMVETFSREFIPSDPVVESVAASISPAAPFRSVRGMMALFLVAAAGLVAEWLIRRKLALR